MPSWSNRVRVKLDFVLEFDRLDTIPPELSHIATFIVGGVKAVLPREEIETKYGGGNLLGGARVSLTHLTQAECKMWDSAHYGKAPKFDGKLAADRPAKRRQKEPSADRAPKAGAKKRKARP